MNRWISREVIGGLVFGGVGMAFMVASLRLELGTPQRMGPGFFPLVLGIAALALSASIILAGLARRQALPDVDWRPLIAVAASIAAFSILLERAGMVPAVIAAVALSSLGDRSTRVISTALLALLLAFGTWLIFRIGLGFPVDAFRNPL
jgi:hypothetical protein